MVMPLWDENPFKRAAFPFVTFGLIAANVAIFIYELTLSDEALKELFVTFGVTPAAIMRGSNLGAAMPSALTLVTSPFLHADLGHLVGNMIFLFVLGDDVEDATGRLRFLVFYVLCGIGASLAFAVTVPDTLDPLVGASGAVAGVVCAYLMLRPCAKVYVLLWPIVLRLAAYWIVGAWILVQLWQVLFQAQDEVAYMAHLGGLAIGALLFPLLRKKGVRLFQCMKSEAPPSLVPWAGHDAGSR
jgi:membrane associated rhomboid family serine protease